MDSHCWKPDMAAKERLFSCFLIILHAVTGGEFLKLSKLMVHLLCQTGTALQVCVYNAVVPIKECEVTNGCRSTLALLNNSVVFHHTASAPISVWTKAL